MNLPKSFTVKQLKQVLLESVIQSQPSLVPAPDQTPNHPIDDEVGTFYIILNPTEGASVENMVTESNLLDLINRVSSGELSKDGIRSVVKKGPSAERQAKRMLHEFEKNLLMSRKTELEELKKKKTYWESRINATNQLYNGQVLDETQTERMTKMQEAIGMIDKKIEHVGKKIQAYKDRKKQSV